MSKTRLIKAVQSLDLEATKALLDAKPSLLGVTDRHGRNLLHLACSASCAKLNVPEVMSARLVNLLLDRGLGIESPVGQDACRHPGPVDPCGRSPRHRGGSDAASRLLVLAKI